MSGAGHLSVVPGCNMLLTCWEKMQAEYLLTLEKAKFRVLRDSL